MPANRLAIEVMRNAHLLVLLLKGRYDLLTTTLDLLMLDKLELLGLASGVKSENCTVLAITSVLPLMSALPSPQRGLMRL